MHIEDLAKEYLTKTDEELVQLATDSEQLTFSAQTALANELAKRRISASDRPKVFRADGTEPGPEQPQRSPVLPSSDSHQVSQFVTDVLHIYHSGFWLSSQSSSPRR